MNNSILGKTLTLFALSLTVLATTTPTLVVKAQDSTGSATAVDPETVKENIKKRIQEVVTEGQGVLGAQSNTKGWTGKVETITTDTITLTSEDKTRLVSIGPNTTIVRSGKDAKLTDVSIGDYVIAMGNPDNNDILNTLRLVANDEEPEKPKQRVIFGTITEIGTKATTITLDTAEGSNTITLKKTSKFTENLPSEVEFKTDILNIGDEAIVIYTVDEKDPALFNLVRFHRTKASTPLPTAEAEEN